VEKAIKEKPDITYEEIFMRYLAEHEGKVIMNQISPRIFEAITLRTALVLFEGEYSGIIKPDIHYISLKKDFSNIDEVLGKLLDDSYLEKLTTRAYTDIVKSGLYSFKQFIQDFDKFLAERRIRTSGDTSITTIIAGINPAAGNIEILKNKPNLRYSFFTSVPLQNKQSVALAIAMLLPIHEILTFRKNIFIQNASTRIMNAMDYVYKRFYLLTHRNRTDIDLQNIIIPKNGIFMKSISWVKNIIFRTL
jgi:hypothetical protein